MKPSFSLLGGGSSPPSEFEYYNCEFDGSSINKNELDTKSCQKFIPKKEGVSLQQQTDDLWINRLKRNQKSIIEIIGLICAIIGLILTYLHYFVF